jgi:hypothetical protein
MHASQEIIPPFFKEKSAFYLLQLSPIHTEKSVFLTEKNNLKRKLFLQIFHFLIDFSFLGLI